jgi:thiol-disulfide isomerase/thioredoxin
MRANPSASVAFAVGVLFLSSTLIAAQNPRTLEIGSAAPDFRLPGVDGREYSLKDFASARLLVIIFTCNHCPTAQAYEQRIIKLHADYRDKGVALVAINPNDPLAVRLDELGYTDLSDTLEEMKIRAKERGFAFPYLYDGETQSTSRAYGVQATPHVYIFDQDRKLRYCGRIDDAEVKQVTSHDTRNAIEALLAGKSVPVQTTRVFGCSTKWADKREDAKRAVEKWNAEPVSLKEIDAEAAKMLAQNDSKKLRLVNLWATWCGPCIAEMPELVTMNRMYRGRPFEMITISMDTMDKKDPAMEKLKELHVSSANYIYSGADRDKLADAVDKEWSGALPLTVLIAPGGKIIYRKTGQIDALELRHAIADYVGRTY